MKKLSLIALTLIATSTTGCRAEEQVNNDRDSSNTTKVPTNLVCTREAEGELGKSIVISGHVIGYSKNYSRDNFRNDQDRDNAPAHAGVRILGNDGILYKAFTPYISAKELRSVEPHFKEGKSYQMCAQKVIYRNERKRNAFGDRYMIDPSTIELVHLADENNFQKKCDDFSRASADDYEVKKGTVQWIRQLPRQRTPKECLLDRAQCTSGWFMVLKDKAENEFHSRTSFITHIDEPPLTEGYSYQLCTRYVPPEFADHLEYHVIDKPEHIERIFE